VPAPVPKRYGMAMRSLPVSISTVACQSMCPVMHTGRVTSPDESAIAAASSCGRLSPMFMSMPAKSTSTRAGENPRVVTSTLKRLDQRNRPRPMLNSTCPPFGKVTAQACCCRSQTGSGWTVTSALGSSIAATACSRQQQPAQSAECQSDQSGIFYSPVFQAGRREGHFPKKRLNLTNINFFTSNEEYSVRQIVAGHFVAGGDGGNGSSTSCFHGRVRDEKICSENHRAAAGSRFAATAPPGPPNRCRT
jgi:hypothetical protein